MSNIFRVIFQFQIAAMIEAIKNELEMIEVLKKECDNKFAVRI